MKGDRCAVTAQGEGAKQEELEAAVHLFDQLADGDVAVTSKSTHREETRSVNDRPESLVVVLRAWQEPNGVRARILVERFDGSHTDSATADIEDVLERIRRELEWLGGNSV